MTSLLWAGAAAFGVGAALVALLARGLDGYARAIGVICTFVPLSIGTWYLLMATGFALRVGDRLVYWGRFADGLTAIPLFVLLLALLADADRTTTVTGMAVGGYTMLATLLATVTTGTAKLAWLAVAVGAFCALLWVLFGPLGRAATSSEPTVAALFARTRLLVVALFSLYPVLWLLGEPGFALAPGEWLVPARLVVDAALKIGVPLSVVGSDALRGQSSSASDASRASS
jgi:bacteriorhodopsin